MPLEIIKFLLIYFVYGFILSKAISHFKIYDKKASLLLGYGLAPLLTSLNLYLLYAIIPHQNWIIYFLVLNLPYLLLLIFLFFREHASFFHIGNFNKGTNRPNGLYYVFILFIFLVLLLVFIRGVLYPTTWIDEIEYLKQGYVYSKDLSLSRMGSNVPFLSLGIPYYMNPAINPAVPILHSYFFLGVNELSSLFAIRFTFFYYLILTIFLIVYLCKSRKIENTNILSSLVIIISCFYFISFTILGFKEIIIAFLTLFSTFFLYRLFERKNQNFLLDLALFGTLLGLNSFINLSGIIISFIFLTLFFIFLKKDFFKKVLFTFLLLIIINLISGNQLVSESRRFILNKSMITTGQTVALENSELDNYKISSENSSPNSDKLNLLIKGKLQSVTQIQFYGLIFVLFWVLVIFEIPKLTKRKRERNNFKFALISFTVTYLFVMCDPFSLNPHVYAYVLAISPKYVLIVVPIIGVVIADNYKSIKNILARLNPNFITAIFLLLSLLLTPLLRNYTNPLIFKLLGKVVPIYNNPEYYLSLLNMFLVAFGSASLAVATILIYWNKRFKSEISFKANFYNFLFLMFLFILPFVVVFNSNYNIKSTIAYTFSDNDTKLVNTATTSDDKDIYKLINYINDSVSADKKINVLCYNNKLDMYIKNSQRLSISDLEKETSKASAIDLINENKGDYLIVCKKQLEVVSHPTVLNEFGNIYLLNFNSNGQ